MIALCSIHPPQSCEQLPWDEEVGRKPKEWRQGILLPCKEYSSSQDSCRPTGTVQIWAVIIDLLCS